MTPVIGNQDLPTVSEEDDA